MSYRSGFFAILGPPNVGKSTLLNRILGRKVSIVSPKPQTTRNRILGVYHGPEHQMVFLDTPGVHRTSTALHRSMVASALAALQEVDRVLLVTTPGTGPDAPDIQSVLKALRPSGRPCLLVLNKIDQVPKPALLPVLDAYAGAFPFEDLIPVSALTGEGVKELLTVLEARLQPGPAFFPQDMDTDQPEPFLIAETIREKIYFHTQKEIPYACAVTVDRVEEPTEKGILHITAQIHVETPSQKKILIGRQGAMIKTIGQSSREDLERVFGTRVFLGLTVRVEEGWTRDTRAMRRLGY